MSEVREARVGRIRKLRLLAFASTLLSGLASERSLAKKGQRAGRLVEDMHNAFHSCGAARRDEWGPAP
jgi:hypothetical protein